MNKREKDKEGDMVSIDSQKMHQKLIYQNLFSYLFIIYSAFFIQNEEDKRLQEELLQAVDVLKVNRQTLTIDIR
jgi:hypothetical protein